MHHRHGPWTCCAKPILREICRLEAGSRTKDSRKRMAARRRAGGVCATGADDCFQISCFDFRASAPLNKIPLGQCTCYVGINIELVHQYPAIFSTVSQVCRKGASTNRTRQNQNLATYLYVLSSRSVHSPLYFYLSLSSLSPPIIAQCNAKQCNLCSSLTLLRGVPITRWVKVIIHTKASSVNGE